MQYDAVIEESLCYKMVRTLYSSFLASVFFRIFAGFARAIFAVSKEAVLNSESRRLFISCRTACKRHVRYLMAASILSVVLCYVFFGLLVSGKINYMLMILFCIAVLAVYLAKTGAGKYAAAIYCNSYVFRLLDKKI